MTKREVEDQRLSPYVVMPPECDQSFLAWWRSLESEHSVNVRYPHQRHGNAGMPSHSAKTDAKIEFLKFVDINSQPNGRSLDSSSATHFFLPKFRTVQEPKFGVSRREQRLTESLLGEFNRTQREKGHSTISNFSASTWLKRNG